MMSEALPKKSLAFRFASNVLLVLRENAYTPTDTDWDDFLRVLVENRANFAKLRILVRTEGGGPNVAQRKRLQTALDGRPIRVAVVTNSLPVRFLVSSIALLNREIRSFANDEIASAYEHLGLSPAEQRLAERVLAELSMDVEF
jgi:hypothetical protein